MSRQNAAISERPAVAPERDAATTVHWAAQGWVDWLPGDGTTRYRVHIETVDDEIEHAERVLLISNEQQTLAFPFAARGSGPQWSEHRCGHERLPSWAWGVARPLLVEFGAASELPTQRCRECPAIVVMASLPDDELDQATWYEDDDEGGGVSLEGVTVTTGLPPFTCYLAQPENNGTVQAISLRLGQIAGARAHGQQLFRKHTACGSKKEGN